MLSLALGCLFLWFIHRFIQFSFGGASCGPGCWQTAAVLDTFSSDPAELFPSLRARQPQPSVTGPSWPWLCHQGTLRLQDAAAWGSSGPGYLTRTRVPNPAWRPQNSLPSAEAQGRAQARAEPGVRILCRVRGWCPQGRSWLPQGTPMVQPLAAEGACRLCPDSPAGALSNLLFPNLFSCSGIQSSRCFQGR